MSLWMIHAIGWIGAILVLYAYIMVSLNKVKGDAFQFQAANIFGAICLIINTYHLRAYPSTVVNIIWVIVALFSLQKGRLKLFKK